MKRLTVSLGLCSLMLTPALAQGRYAPASAGNQAPYGYVPAMVPNPYAYPYSPYSPYSPYGNTPYGYSPVRPYGGVYSPYPTSGYGIPQSIGGNFFGINAGGATINMWRAPSGYYYPWYASAMPMSNAPIVIVQNGSTQASEPPLSTQFTDMFKYLDEQKEKGKLSEGEFTHLKQRALDLMSKERDLRTQGSGSLDAEQEREIRADVSSLGGEIARKVKP